MHNCQKKAYSSCGRFQKAGRLLQLSIVHNTAGKAKKINPTTRNTTIETNEDIGKDIKEMSSLRGKPRTTIADAVALWHRAELRHDVDSMYKLGLLYAHGNGVERDLNQSNLCFARAAQRGHLDAQHSLAVNLRLGRGVSKDPAAAIRFWKEAAIKGHVAAQTSLASMYLRGIGTKKDLRKALEWFTKAALLGSSDAMFHIWKINSLVNEQTAEHWLEKAANLGHVEARLALAAAHTRRRGRRAAIFQPSSSSNEQVKEHLPSALRGDADAQFNLGVLYAFGVDNTHWSVDDSLAVQWFSAAAKSGHANAQCCLAFMHEHGRGIPRNTHKAKHWYAKAALQGQAIAKQSLSDIINKINGKVAPSKNAEDGRFDSQSFPDIGLGRRRNSDQRCLKVRHVRRLSEQARQKPIFFSD